MSAWTLLVEPVPDGSGIDLTCAEISLQESVIGGMCLPRPPGWTRLDREYSLFAEHVAEHLVQSGLMRSAAVRPSLRGILSGGSAC